MKDIKTYIIETKQSLINKFINNILSNLNNKGYKEFHLKDENDETTWLHAAIINSHDKKLYEKCNYGDFHFEFYIGDYQYKGQKYPATLKFIERRTGYVSVYFIIINNKLEKTENYDLDYELITQPLWFNNENIKTLKTDRSYYVKSYKVDKIFTDVILSIINDYKHNFKKEISSKTLSDIRKRLKEDFE